MDCSCSPITNCWIPPPWSGCEPSGQEEEEEEEETTFFHFFLLLLSPSRLTTLFPLLPVPGLFWTLPPLQFLPFVLFSPGQFRISPTKNLSDVCKPLLRNTVVPESKKIKVLVN